MQFKKKLFPRTVEQVLIRQTGEPNKKLLTLQSVRKPIVMRRYGNILASSDTLSPNINVLLNLHSRNIDFGDREPVYRNI